jgi:hypothetical protein
MPTEFRRTDLPVRVQSGEHGRHWVVGCGEFSRQGVGEDPPPQLFANLPVEAFRRSEPPGTGKWVEELSRVVLSLDLELASLDWESLFQPLLAAIAFPSPGWSSKLVVRQSEARPRFADTNFKLPLRILELDARPEHPLPSWIRQVFQNYPDPLVEKAVVVETRRLGEEPPRWPVIDVLHLDTWPAGRAEELLTNDATRPGTLGWFARWTGAWQTRLLAIHCASGTEAAAARTLAQRLCDKGGPALLIGPAGVTEAFWTQFYDWLIHDFPLDAGMNSAASTVGRQGVLYAAGWERAEGVRVSSAGMAIADLARQAGRSTARITDFAQNWNEHWEFAFHESGGLIPMAATLDDLRTDAANLSLNAWRGADTGAKQAQRFVNGAFWHSANHTLERIAPASGPLRTGVRYEFGVQIGEQDRETAPLDAKAILEEIFQWSVNDDGVWVEIGVVGLDFEVEGDPVQPLWLPREGASSTAYFGVSTRSAGAVQLRYGLYYQNNLIQSFRMAAYAAPLDGQAPPDASKSIAGALEVAPERVRGLYQARMEYSRTSAFSELGRKSARAVTIVANQLKGKVVLTTKATDVFDTVVCPDDGMPKIVQDVRERLNAIAYDASKQYRFGPYAPDPDGMLADALRSLAKVGFGLYFNLAPKPATRKALEAALSGTGKLIHVAHLLRKKVVPWAFVYDREFDDGAKTWKGNPVEQGVCLAPLGPNGLEPGECGTHENCLLGEKVRAERQSKGLAQYCERTVVCPLRFWGFRHAIEVPAQQTEDDQPNEEASCIVPLADFRLIAGFNQQLATAATHWAQLSGGRAWSPPEYDRDEILDRLRDPEIDFIYFFCHARGGELDDPSIDPPYLEFQPSGTTIAQSIEPQNLADTVTWDHRPLVFLNACGTLGYSPDALSPFLKALVDGRGAAGVLGTEIPVPEALAGEVACAFIRRFIAGVPAGKALLEARQDLLAKKNPLGLIYTLYAPTELAVDTDADGKCG